MSKPGGPDVMPVQLSREFRQQGMHGAGGYALDDELPACHADRQGGPILQQHEERLVDGVHRLPEQRMPRRIDRVLVHRDRELHQKLGELS